jgi:hypothetical protein
MISDSYDRGRLDNMTVAHLYYSSAHCCSFRIVSNHDDRLIEAVVELLKHVQYDFGILGIQISSWLVGEHDGCPRNHGARQRYSLLLTAGKLDRL